MHTVAPFSHFSASSELLVTAGVAYFFWRAVRHDDYRWGFIWILIAFETLVNITYMASRLASHTPSPDYPAWTTWLLAMHGILSLIMFLGLIAFVIIAFKQRHVANENFFRSHGSLTVYFLVFWGLSVASGELIYALQVFDVIGI